MNHRKYLVFMAVLSGFFMTGSDIVSAETHVFPLDPIIVEAERRADYSVLKYKEKKEKIPFAYTVVNEKDLHQRGGDLLKDTLNYTSGVVGTIVDEALFNNSMIRGFEVNYTGVTLNGMKMFRNDKGTVNSAEYDTLYSPEIEGLESVTIVKGPASVHHGAASPGGSIDLQLKHAVLREQGQGEVEIGSRRKKVVSFDVNHLLSQESAIRVTMVHRKNDLDIDMSSNERWYIAPTYHIEKKGKNVFRFLRILAKG